VAVEGSRVTLRKARPNDAPAIAEIWHAGWQDAHLGLVPQQLVDARTTASFRARAQDRIADTTVATADGAVAGFVMVVDDEVEQVYVAGPHRGSEIAASLMAEAERQVAANGHDKAWLAVVPGNTRAQRFYERAGWVDEGPFEYAPAADGGRVAVTCERYTKLVG
jgi:ribosomal protein S18 acetylase RimI-like enzyme